MKPALKPLLYPSHPLPTAPNPSIRLLWPLCFHGLTNSFSRNLFSFMNICVAPGVWGPHFIPNSRSQVHLRQHVYSQWLTASWILLPLFFEFPFFVFSNLRTLFAKCRRVGGPLDFARLRRSNSGDQDLRIVYAVRTLRTCQPSATVLKSTRHRYDHL